MNRDLYNQTIKTLKEGQEIKGSFGSGTGWGGGRTIEFNSSNQVLNENLSFWYYDYEDILLEAEGFQSNSGEIELIYKGNYLDCKIEGWIDDEYFEKHTKDELITTIFLDVISQYTSKAKENLVVEDFDFNITCDLSEEEFETIDIYINDNPICLSKEHLDKIKEEFISVFNLWDDTYPGEDYDEIKKYIEIHFDDNDFDVTEIITIIRCVDPDEI